MTVTDADRRAADLSLAWDALLAGRDASPSSLGPEILDTLRLVDATREPTPLDATRIDQIWEQVIASVAPLWTPDAMAAPPAIGRRRRRSVLGWTARRLPWRAVSVPSLLGVTARFAWVVVAGFLGGFVAGIASRLAMRLAGFLTNDRNRGLPTDNGNTVGEITLGGTLFLGLLGGALGIGVLLLYLGVRDRLPGEGWRRSAVFSTLLLVVFGYVVMDAGNPDYQLFGPPWLNVGTFSALYLVMGFSTCQAYEVSRRLRAWLPQVTGYQIVRLPMLAVSPLIAGLGVLMMVPMTFVGITGVPMLGLGVIAWLGSHLAARWSLALPRLPTPVARWGLLSIPMLLGLALTLRGITRILTG